MTLISTNESGSVFRDGKLWPGIYKIQNIVGQTYVDIQEHTRELCGRPAAALEGKGLWEILPSGPGYTIRRLEPGKPEQFCIMLGGLTNESRVSVAIFPVAWRIEMVSEGDHRGRGYVRFFWGTTNMTWDLANYGSDKDRTPVQLKDNHDYEQCRIWKLIPVVKSDLGPRSTEEPIPIPSTGSSSLPPYDGDQHCTCSHRSSETSTNDDGFGTTIVEVTIATTTNTVITRKKYRVEGD